MSRVRRFAAASNDHPVFIGRGRISVSTAKVLQNESILKRVQDKFEKLGVPLKRPAIVWDPYISRFIDTTPDIRGGFTQASKDPKFPNRKVHTPEEIGAMMSRFPGSHFILPFAISGDNLGERFMQLIDLCELTAEQSKDAYTLDIILPKPFGDRNDKDHVRDGHKLFNAKTISSISRILKQAYNAKRFYLCEPHSFNAMRQVQKFFNGDAYFPSFAPALGKSTIRHLKKIGLGKTFTMDDVAAFSPDGGLKHLIGSARYLAYMKARGYDVPAPSIYNKEPFMQINAAYDESLKFYSENPQAPFDFERDEGPQASIERAWRTHLFIKGLPTDTDLPLRLEDFPPDFPLYDKQRKNDTTIDALTLIHGDVKGKIVLSIDDISATGGTQVTCAAEAYKNGAKLFIPVLMHGGFVGFTDAKDKKKFDGTDNGLHYMLTRKHPGDAEKPLFPVVMFSNSAPSAEDFKTKLLCSYPELHDRVEVIDVAEVTAECGIDSMLQEQHGLHNPDLVRMPLPEVALHEKYKYTLTSNAAPSLIRRPA